jgi:hypothetical protein
MSLPGFIFFCEHGGNCKWQGFGWGKIPKGTDWHQWHVRECGGTLAEVQISAAQAGTREAPAPAVTPHASDMAEVADLKRERPSPCRKCNGPRNWSGSQPPFCPTCDVAAQGSAGEAPALEGAALTWSREKPTTAGWYWRRTSIGIQSILQVAKNEDHFAIDRGWGYDPLGEECEWAGPIPAPAAPGGAA